MRILALTLPRPSGLATLLISLAWLLLFPVLALLATGTFMAASGPSGGLVGFSTGVLISVPVVIAWLGVPLWIAVFWLRGRRSRGHDPTAG